MFEIKPLVYWREAEDQEEDHIGISFQEGPMTYFTTWNYLKERAKIIFRSTRACFLYSGKQVMRKSGKQIKLALLLLMFTCQNRVENIQHLAPPPTNHRIHLRKLSQYQVSLLASFSHTTWWLIFKAFPFHYLQTILFCRWKAAFCFSSALIITIWSFIRAQGLFPGSRFIFLSLDHFSDQFSIQKTTQSDVVLGSILGSRQKQLCGARDIDPWPGLGMNVIR